MFNRCQYVTNSAMLATDFGLRLAMTKLAMTEKDLENLVGRYTRGKYKGKLRGSLTWNKTIKAGWVKLGPYDWEACQADGFVCRLVNFTFNYSINDSWTGELIFAGPDYNSFPPYALSAALEKREKLLEKNATMCS